MGAGSLMNRRIRLLAAIHVAAGALLIPFLQTAGPARTAPLEVAAFAAAFALVGFLPIHLEFRRASYSLVLDEAVWVVALFRMTPIGVVAAAVAGEVISRIFARQAPHKTAYNLGSTFLAATLGAGIFAAFGRGDAGDPLAWAVAVAAMAALSGASLMSISAVLALVEGRRFGNVLLDSISAQAVVTTANASIGVAAAVLLHTNPVGPLVLAPVIVAVVLASRSQTLQAARHLRFERLYAAAARTGQLGGLEEALAALAAEARALLTGSVAICAASRSTGGWIGAEIDDAGVTEAAPDALAALTGLAEAGKGRTVALDNLAPGIRKVLPEAADLVVSASAVPGTAVVVLAVFREIAPDCQGRDREEVIAAFAGHAALVVANARLFEEVDAALHREMALGRQKSEFVAAVSHELRTPLTTVLGAVATIQRLEARLEPATRDRLLSRALDQGARLRRLIDELLLVAAAQHSGLAADIRPVDLTQVAANVAADFVEAAGPRLRVEPDPAVGQFPTDEEKLHRILGNLVENALKYAPDGPITLGTARTAAGVALSVTDHGPGIPQAERHRVFEPFIQLDQSSTRRQGGTGLGLHLCQQLARLLGGHLDLEETAGGGCCFTLHLYDPAVPDRAVSARVAEGAPV